jgi:hypothetical protein
VIRGQHDLRGYTFSVEQERLNSRLGLGQLELQSLAQDQHERAICIVLSGTGTDGTLGRKEIKSQSGMTIWQKKIDELSQANNDMNKLLAGTGIGTIFVNNRLLIQRFTPAATKVINLIQTENLRCRDAEKGRLPVLGANGGHVGDG